MTDAIVLRGLTKTFGDTVAVRDLALTVPTGALYGVIGPNGAGKTTAIRIILSILLPDRGDVSVLGHRSAFQAKDRIGYLPEERGLYRKMRVRQFLEYMARLKSADGHGLDRRIRQWLHRVGLEGVEEKRCEELSKGMQQKVQLLAAIIHEPDLLILDEPFSGLDPVSQRLLRDIVVEEHERGATILFSTHVMTHAEQLCDHVVMIHRGAKMLDEPMREIRARHNPRTILFEPFDPDADTGVLATLPGVESMSRNGRMWEIGLSASSDPPEVIRTIAGAVAPARIELKRPSLEDVFVSIVAADAAPDDATRLRAAVRDDSGAGLEVRS